jgi:hypothetical protein
MPNLVGLLDDEMQQVNGTLPTPGLAAGTKHVLQDALVQDTQTESKVNQYWPPLPAAG